MTEQRPLPMTVEAWAAERLANCNHMARLKIGKDRDGWIEDAAYWRQIVRLAADRPRRRDPAMSNAAIEAVVKRLRRYDDPMLEFRNEDRAADVIATVFDHMPRKAMAQAAVELNPWFRGRDAAKLIDAALAAAQSALLPGDAQGRPADPDGTR